MSNSKNARRSERHTATFGIDVADYANPKKKTAAVVTNISEGGFCFESDHKIEVGASLTFHLKVPLIVQGGVVYSQANGKKFRYGVRFHNVRLEGEQTFAKPRTMVRKELLNLPPR
ncbi:MAG: PilZ domain-containing protein [Elusimicrobia bacterium]|nr:PilZ domain-containing protein [Elusimicrobiota bacterium]